MKTLIALFVALFAAVSCVVVGNAASITASWTDNSTNESGFSIERSVDGGEFVEISRTGPDVVNYVDAGPFVGGSTYSYRLRAFNKAGFSVYSNTASLVWPTIPNAPAALIIVID